MADEKNIVDDEDEFAVRHNPYAQLPSNSSKSMQPSPAKHVPRVKSSGFGSGVAKKQEKSEVKSTFSKIWDWIFNDVLVPTAKDVASDIIRNSADMIIYRDDYSRRRRNSGSSYSSYYRRSSDRDRDRDRDRRERDREKNSRRRGSDWEDIFIDRYDENGDEIRKADVERKLKDLIDISVDYGVASVADLYDLVGITANITDERIGWYKGELRGATVRQLRDGFLICTPDPGPIKTD